MAVLSMAVVLGFAVLSLGAAVRLFSRAGRA